jgi:nickel-dependent lactate racemase
MDGGLKVEITMNYGKGKESFNLDPSKIIEVLKPKEIQALRDPIDEVMLSLENPIGTPSLLDMLLKRHPSKVVVIVNDITRPTPYEILLPPLLDTFKTAGISKENIIFITATGIHDPHSVEDDRSVYGNFLVDNYRVISHVADDKGNLVYMGKLDSGIDFYLNKNVYNADFIITLGVIAPHYFAGFSGGRKSILPGVSGRKTIESNHSRMVELMDDLPPLEKNPVNLEMIEAARIAKVDFILNVVPNSKMEIVKIVAGDMEKAWYEGAKLSSKMFEVTLKQKADVVIVSTGGYPRDINVYQMQKALDHADRATRDGGTIIVLAECPMGLGEKTFEEWMNTASCPDDIIKRIKKEFALGGHKAFGISKVAAKKNILLVSKLCEETTELLFMKKCKSVQKALDILMEKHGENLKYILMPIGSLTVPVYRSL